MRSGKSRLMQFAGEFLGHGLATVGFAWGIIVGMFLTSWWGLIGLPVFAVGIVLMGKFET